MLKLDIFNKEIQSSEQRFDSVYILESGDASNAPTISGYLPANYIFGDISLPINIVQANDAETQTVDIVSDEVQLTRGSYGVLHNPLYDSEGDNNPTNTEWNEDGWTDLENVTGRTYTDLNQIGGGGNFGNAVIGTELVMHDTSTDKYYKVVFDAWQAGAGQNPNYRGFSYTRTELGYKQEVTGLVNFTTRPTINGSGVLLQGDIVNFPNTIVYTTGDQDIAGLKDFQTRPTVIDIPVLLSGDPVDLIHLYGKNDETTTIYKGQPVYIGGANGANPLIKIASNTGERTSSKTIGLLAQDLLVNEFGYVITEGTLEGFNTSAGAAGDPIWLGPTGSLLFGTGNKPYAPNHLVYLGVVLRSNQNNGKVYVRTQNGYEVDEFHNVVATNPQNKDTLIYNSGSGLWITRQINTGDVSGISNYYLNSNPSGYITNQDVVFATGTQNIQGNKTFANIITTGQIIEQFQSYSTTINANASVTLNCISGNIWNINSTVNGNWIAALTNIGTSTNQGTNVKLILNQAGSSTYIPTGLTINGNSSTINWQGGAVPVGASGKKDIVSFSLLQTGTSSYLTFGQLVSFG